MKVHRDIEHLPEFRNAVVTIGTFDGVHLGHQKIISQLKSEAERVDGETVIITFHPHPRKIVANRSHNIQLITTIDERIELLAEKGVDHLVIVPFTLHFSEMEPKSYVEEFLKKKCNPAVVIIGYDHRFGRERQGDYKLLEQYSAKGFFELKEISQQLINDSIVSSTAIRESLKAGDVDQANRLLGYDFFFEGTVVKGDQLGRTIGYPTANLAINERDKIIPGDGIYAVEVVVVRRETGDGRRETGDGRRETGDGRRETGDSEEQRAKGKKLPAMMSIGVRPTVGGTHRTIEVNIFDFEADIYGERLRVYVKHYLRPEVKFNGLEELKAALGKDKEDTLRLFKTTP